MKDKELQQIADKILQLQLQCKKNFNLEQNLQDIEKIAKNLSLEDIIFVDNYIQNKLTR